MLEVCKFSGPNAVLFMSNNNKARIPLGLAADNLQALLFMHSEYKVKLLDHDFVIGLQHKLIPSVYRICKINNTGDTLYGGDTFIRVRSGKHDTSNAYTHALDVQDIFQSKLRDAAQNKAPHFPKAMATAFDIFFLLYLGILFHEVNAAGLSAFNPVEFRMAPLSHDFTEIDLPYDHFGNHLDPSGKLIDHEMEKKNFQKFAEVLSEVWEKTVIDGHSVNCRAVPLRSLNQQLLTWCRWKTLSKISLLFTNC